MNVIGYKKSTKRRDTLLVVFPILCFFNCFSVYYCLHNNARLGFFNKFRFQLHRAKAFNLAVDIMISLY